jgi:hypothetical protein
VGVTKKTLFKETYLMGLVVERRPTVRYLLYSLKKHQFDIVISEEWQVQERKNRSTEGNYTGTWHMQHFVSKSRFMREPVYIHM